MKISIKTFTIFTLFVMLLLAGCSGSNGKTGATGPQGPAGTNGQQGPAGPTMPVIQSLSVVGLPAIPGSNVTTTVIAQSAQNLALTYTWTATSPWSVSPSSVNSQTATITAPSGYAITGTATIKVSDTQGRYAIGMIALSTQGNSAPIISNITIYPQPVYTAANLVCNANDPDGDTLNYTWLIGGTSVTTGSNALWYSPGIPGYYTVGITVTDNSGNSVTGSSYMSIASGSPWPKFHRDIQSTGLSPINTSSITGTTKWSYATSNAILSSPAIGADGTIYVGSTDNSLYAINPDGTEKWSYATGNPILFSSPAIGADGTIYVGSYDHSLYAINPDGTKKWSYATGNAIYSSPAIGADGTIYVGSYDHSLYAINPDGTKKWIYATGNEIDSSPAIGADGTIYVGSEDNSLYAIH